jgi:hypothetical protein
METLRQKPETNRCPLKCAARQDEGPSVQVVGFSPVSSAEDNNSDNEAEQHRAGEAERRVLIATQNAEFARALEDAWNREVELQQNQPEPARQATQPEERRRVMLQPAEARRRLTAAAITPNETGILTTGILFSCAIAYNMSCRVYMVTFYSCGQSCGCTGHCGGDHFSKC